MEAAFFDLDKTVIAKASMVAFGPPLYRAGMISRWLVARALWSQFVFQRMGADEERMRKFRESALRITRGWDQARISAIVRDTLTEVIDPIVYDEALDLIREHQAAGRRVYLISASPEEIVAPLARYLGVDEAIASRARLDDDGRYTGEVEFYSYGPFKAEAIVEAAVLHDIDLDGVLRLLGLGHRPAHARGRRSPGGGQPRPGAGPGGAATGAGRCASSATASRCANGSTCPRPARTAVGAAGLVIVVAAGRRGVVALAHPTPPARAAIAGRSGHRDDRAARGAWRRRGRSAAQTAISEIRRPAASSPRRRPGQRRR